MNPTQEIIKRLFLSIAISVAALIAGTSSVTAAVTRCDGVLQPGTYDTVLVPKGKNCTVVGDVTTVEGNVILQEGASILGVVGVFTVNGNLQGDGVRRINLFANPGVEIHGNVSITGATDAAILIFANIGGNLNISNSNAFQIILTNSVVTGNALFQNNTLKVFNITDDTIVGNLVCNGNDPAPNLGSPDTNTVTGQRIGQCSLP